jgi:hypothetical protein
MTSEMMDFWLLLAWWITRSIYGKTSHKMTKSASKAAPTRHKRTFEIVTRVVVGDTIASRSGTNRSKCDLWLIKVSSKMVIRYKIQTPPCLYIQPHTTQQSLHQSKVLRYLNTTIVLLFEQQDGEPMPLVWVFQIRIGWLVLDSSCDKSTSTTWRARTVVSTVEHLHNCLQLCLVGTTGTASILLWS